MTKEEFRDYILFKLMDMDLTGWNYVAVDHDGFVYIYIICPKCDIGLHAFHNVGEDCDAPYKFGNVILDLDELGINWTDTLVKL